MKGCIPPGLVCRRQFASLPGLARVLCAVVISLGAMLSSAFADTFGYTGAVQTFAVPQDGYYLISATGATGGRSDSSGFNGGSGATQTGFVYLKGGTVLNVVVGGAGGTDANDSDGGGGGGGSFVYIDTSTPLVVAGGGGGAGASTDGANYSIDPGFDAPSSSDGGAGGGDAGGAGGSNGNSGSAGHQGAWDGGGGAGFFHDGQNADGGDTSTNGKGGGFGGRAPTSFAGGAGDGTWNYLGFRHGDNSGGFGGGGGGGYQSGGGGGGYSGGGGGGGYYSACGCSCGNCPDRYSYPGGGGGSFIVSSFNGRPTLQASLTTGTNSSGSGSVSITAESQVVVTNSKDSGSGSLRDALIYIAGGGTITFDIPITDSGYDPNSGTYSIALSADADDTFGPSALVVDKAVTIDAGTNKIIITRDTAANAARLRLFYVTPGGNLRLKNLTLSNGRAQGGNGGVGGNGDGAGGGAAGLGGAILVNGGSLGAVGCTFVNNQAVGGNGGPATSPGNTGGGGGLGGDGTGTGGPPNGGSTHAAPGGFGGGGAGADLGNCGVLFCTADPAGGDGGFGGGGGGGKGAFLSPSDHGGMGGFGGGGGGGGLNNNGGGGRGGFGAGTGGTQGGGGGGGAGLGGAIFNYAGAVSITNSTLAANSASGGVGGASTYATYAIGTAGAGGSSYGGAIFNLNGTVTATNATLTNNTAAAGGGAICSLGDNGIATQGGPALPSTTATVLLTNTILSNSNNGANTPAAVSDFYQNTNDSGTATNHDTGAVSSDGTNDIVQTRAAASTNNFGGTATNVDPKLNSLGYNGGVTQTISLLAGSPAIEGGADVTTLSNSIDEQPATTTLPVTDASVFSSGVTIQVDSEQMLVTGFSGNTLTVIRATGGTTIAAHSNGAAVNPAFDQRGPGFPRKGGTAIDIGAFELAPPRANADTYATNEDSALSVTAAIGVLANDAASYGGTLTAAVATGPAHSASFTLHTDGSFDYTPAKDYNGADSFTYTASESVTGVTASATVTISISAINDPPTVGNNTGMTVDQGSTGNPITSSMLSVNDIDNTPAQLTFTVAAAPANGTLKRSSTALSSGNTFTQADINNGLLTYDHNASATTIDSFTVTVSDGAGGSIGATAFNITVTPASADHFAVVSQSSSVNSGVAFNFTVTALSRFNTKVTGYSGTVHFTSNDGQASLPADSSLSNGTATFSATLRTAGNGTITATDAVTSTITGTSNSIAVSAAAATHLTVSAPSSADAGVPFNFTVTARDSFNNTATGYSGTAHFTTTDAQAVLPGDSTLTNGSRTFTATLRSTGTHTITATDATTGSITGTSDPITLRPVTYVVTSTADPGDGTCDAAGTGDGCTLREAIHAASVHGGTAIITFNIPKDGSQACDSGTGVCTITLDGEELSIQSDVIIQGLGANVLTVSGNMASRVFSTNPGTTVTISGMTIRDGKVSGESGGGIHNDHATLTLTNSTISGNSAEYSGGGIFNDSANYGSARLTINNSTISGNSADDSGAILNEASYGSATVMISNSTITGNSATVAGVIYNDGNTGVASVTISNSTISGNSAVDDAGVIFNYGATVTISNSTLSGNSAGSAAGAIFNDGDYTSTTLQIQNSTLSGNSGSGGVIVNSGHSGSAEIFLRNTILNTDPSGKNIYNYDGAEVSSNGYNLSSDEGVTNFGGTTNFPNEGDQINTDPMLGPLQDNGGPTLTQALLPGSPAMDAGTDVTFLYNNKGAIDKLQTSINVASSTGIGPGFEIQIGTEQMVVTAVSGQTLTVTRAANNTAAASHNDLAAVNPAFDQRGTGYGRKLGAHLDIGAFEADELIGPSDSDTAPNTVVENAANGSATGLTAAEADPEGATVTYSIVSDSSNGGFTIDSSTGVVTVADHRKIDFESSGGSYSVAVQSSNATSTATHTFIINVTDVAPVGAADSYTLEENSTLDVAPGAGVLVNDSDVNGGTLSAVLISQPSHASAFSLSTDGSFTYTPAANYIGSDSFTYQPSAGTLAGTTVTVSLTVSVVATPAPTPTATPSATPGATVTPTPTATATPTAAAAEPMNISTRMEVLSGDNVLIAGLIVTGDAGATKKVMIRGLGPSLAQAGVSNPLADPLLELHGPVGFATVVNDNWADATNASDIPNGFQPSDSRESVIIATLTIGPEGFANYTAIVRGSNGETGVGLVEAYDLQAGTNQFANISTRGFIETGDNVMIGGFILSGSDQGSKVLIRAIGPSLTDQGVSGALADPTLELFDSQGTKIRSNDNWKIEDTTGQSQEASITATTIPPSNDLESAILDTFPPGAYTAIVAGKNQGTGVALVEVYNLR